MWWLIVRQPRADARVWPGRRLWAFVDALVWPSAVALAAVLVQGTGLLGPVVLAVALVMVVRRVWQALFLNERYRFTTLGLATPLAVLVAIGALIKVFA